MPALHAMRLRCDLNCDMGEGIGNDAALMPFISSANIACGYHAGDAASMYETARLALAQGVQIGAHPSFNDREHFGRRNLQLPPADIYELVTQQLYLFQQVLDELDTRIVHVKPHGALYNLSATHPETAAAIARAVVDFDSRLLLVGLSGSCSISAARAAGLATVQEVFADRSYQANGTLTPRTQPGALLENETAVVQQVLQMVNTQTVTALTGETIPMEAGTVCIHGDGPHALRFAQALYTALLMPEG